MTADTTTAIPDGTRGLPKWAADHFRQSIDAHALLMEIVDISERGIGVLRGMPKAVKVLAKFEGREDDPRAVKHLERAEKEAALATTEVNGDFPVLHGLAVVALWSWLEHFVKGFIALWLLNHPGAVNSAAVQKLRVRLGDYLQLDKDEQAHFLVELLEQEQSGSLKRGVTRFDSLLDHFGLTSNLPDGCGKMLFELQQVRNAIAHRNGRADRRLLTECPWLSLDINGPVVISSSMLGAYSEAAGDFLLAMLYRVGDVYEVDLRVRAASVA
jgi:hypothetical protein